MRCYECAKADQIEEAVALCRSCSAGLFLTWTAVLEPASNRGQEQ